MLSLSLSLSLLLSLHQHGQINRVRRLRMISSSKSG